MTNKEAIEVLKEEWRINAELFGKQFDEALNLAIKALENERLTGEWKHIGGDEWICSICGRVITTEGSWENPISIGEYHCPNCGVKMK